MVANRAGEPVPPRLDKFKLVQSGTLLPPSSTNLHGLLPVDQMIPNPGGRAVPLNVLHPVIEMDRTRTAVESKPSPIPQLLSPNTDKT